MTRLRIAIAAAAGVGLLMLPPRAALAQTANVNGCATCHAGLADSRLSAPPRAVTNDVHDKAGVHCADCHGGSPMASDATAAHDPAHGYRGKPTASAICGSCHASLDEKFKLSIHAQIFDKACVECHGNHGIRPPSDALVGTSKDAVCSTCHSEKDDPGFAAANRMRASLDRLREGIDVSTRLIDRVKNAGMEVGDQELALADARTKLILARTEMHAFNPDSLDAVITDGMRVVDGVNRGGTRGMAELAYRRHGLFIALAAILLFVLALGLKIRTLRPEAR